MLLGISLLPLVSDLSSSRSSRSTQRHGHRKGTPTSPCTQSYHAPACRNEGGFGKLANIVTGAWLGNGVTLLLCCEPEAHKNMSESVRKGAALMPGFAVALALARDGVWG